MRILSTHKKRLITKNDAARQAQIGTGPLQSQNPMNGGSQPKDTKVASTRFTPYLEPVPVPPTKHGYQRTSMETENAPTYCRTRQKRPGLKNLSRNTYGTEETARSLQGFVGQDKRCETPAQPRYASISAPCVKHALSRSHPLEHYVVTDFCAGGSNRLEHFPKLLLTPHQVFQYQPRFYGRAANHGPRRR